MKRGVLVGLVLLLTVSAVVVVLLRRGGPDADPVVGIWRPVSRELELEAREWASSEMRKLESRPEDPDPQKAKALRELRNLTLDGKPAPTTEEGFATAFVEAYRAVTITILADGTGAYETERPGLAPRLEAKWSRDGEGIRMLLSIPTLGDVIVLCTVDGDVFRMRSVTPPHLTENGSKGDPPRFPHLWKRVKKGT